VAESGKGKRTGAVKKSSPEKKQQNPISKYFRETRGELRKVTWPSREESWRLTAIVLGVTLAMSAFLWLFDTLFSNGVERLIQLFI
jgi:preprotein translocase subunit SecE